MYLEPSNNWLSTAQPAQYLSIKWNNDSGDRGSSVGDIVRETESGRLGNGGGTEVDYGMAIEQRGNGLQAPRDTAAIKEPAVMIYLFYTNRCK